MKPTEENPPDAGFTLIEALVVLTITALAIALVPATVSLGQRALQVAANLEHTTSDHRAREALTARIEAARPIFQTDAAGLSTLVFEGRPDRMRFVSEFSDGPAGGGLYVADLGLDPSNSTLVLSLTPYPTRANATPSTVDPIAAGCLTLSALLWSRCRNRKPHLAIVLGGHQQAAGNDRTDDPENS